MPFRHVIRMAVRCPPELLLRSSMRAVAAASLTTSAATIQSPAAVSYTAAVCTQLGQPLQLLKQARPQLKDNQVRLLIKYAAVNFADILKAQGKYQIKAPLPFVPGFEVAAEVVEVGSKVSRVRSGDHVIALMSRDDGGFSQEVVVADENCYNVKEYQRKSPAEGAALVCSYCTAYLALARRITINSNDTVLVTAAAGALGLAVVDLAANVYNAKVIGACGGAEKCDLVKKSGAAWVVDYTKEDLREKVKEITRGRGVSVVVDMVGGKVFEDCLKNIAYDGHVFTLGYAGGEIPKVALNHLLVKNYSIHGLTFGGYSVANRTVFDETVGKVIELWLGGKIKPHVGTIFPLEKVNEALSFILQRKNTGKVLLDCEKHA